MNPLVAATVTILVSISSTISLACEDGHWIRQVSDGGAVVILEDGSTWLIDEFDRIDTALWLPITDITVCGGQLINTDDGEMARARRIR